MKASSNSFCLLKVGDQVRVHYEDVPDRFRRDSASPPCGGWFPATVKKVRVIRRKKSSSKDEREQRITVQFFDGSPVEEFIYPNADIALLLQGEVARGHSDGNLYNTNGTLFLDAQPQTLVSGDLVLGRFQNGDHWHRGRIAKSGAGTVDILYDDGDYECNIPYGTRSNTIMLIEKGLDHPDWLNGVALPLSSRNLEQVTNGVVVATEPRGLVTIDFSTVLETLPYKEVVESLFNHIRQKESGLRFSVWVEQKTNGKKITTGAAKRAKHSTEMDEDDNETSSMNKDQHDDLSTVDSDYSVYTSDDESMCQDMEASAIKFMRPNVSTALFSALQSCDSLIGITVLTQETQIHGRVPDGDRCQHLVDLLTRGPTRGAVNFPDCHRMDLAGKYCLDLFMQQPQMVDFFAKSVGRSYCSNVLVQIQEPRYVAEGDYTRTSKEALLRIGQSAHSKAWCLEIFLTLLNGQLSDSIRKKEASDGYESLSLVQGIIGLRGGPKEALESAAKSFTHMLCDVGHFALGLSDTTFFESTTDLAFAGDQSRRMLQAMGKVVSYLAWVYGRYSGESDKGIADLLALKVRGWMREAGRELPVFLRTFSCDRLQRHYFFSFVLQLDQRVLPGLKVALATRLGVASQLYLVLGGRK